MKQAIQLRTIQECIRYWRYIITWHPYSEHPTEAATLIVNTKNAPQFDKWIQEALFKQAYDAALNIIGLTGDDEARYEERRRLLHNLAQLEDTYCISLKEQVFANSVKHVATLQDCIRYWESCISAVPHDLSPINSAYWIASVGSLQQSSEWKMSEPLVGRIIELAYDLEVEDDEANISLEWSELISLVNQLKANHLLSGTSSRLFDK